MTMTTTTTTTTITATPRRALSGMALLAMLLLSTSTTSNGFQMQPFAIKKAAMTSSSVTMQTPVSFTALHQKPANAATMPLFSSAAAAASGGSNEDLSSMEEKKKEVEKPVANAKSTPTTPTVGKKKKTYQELRAEGGFGTFNTPIGALNPFAIYYGLTSIFLGIPWFISCKMCQLLYWITGNRFDPKRRIPVFLSHVWGVTLMRLTRCYPAMKNVDVLEKFYKEKRPAMFVANHCSWMDIPFLGATIGWRNYKLISKKELGVVPILGTAIRTGGNIMVDRTDRRSQLATLKQGIGYLKDGIHLCTFPEGTRSRSGRMMKFKNGAFKMAYKAGAPVIPISIVNSHKVMPTGWMMAMRPAHGLAEVIVHEPVESEGKTEEELAQAVRESMIKGLPEDQVPL